MTEKQRFAVALGGLASVFRTATSPAWFGLYEKGLRGMSIGEIERACDLALGQCKFMPAPLELRELAGVAEPSPEDRAGGAWALVLDAIRGVGTYRTPVFADPLIPAAIARIGGWSTLCAKSSEELHTWARKTFCAEYASIGAHGLEPGEGAALVGLHGQSRLAAPERALPAPGDDREGVAKVEALIAGLLS